MSPSCHVCCQPEGQCYGICPTQDPFGGDQAAEHDDYEANARFDDMAERFAGERITADEFEDEEVGTVAPTSSLTGCWHQDDARRNSPTQPVVAPLSDDDIPF